MRRRASTGSRACSRPERPISRPPRRHPWRRAGRPLSRPAAHRPTDLLDRPDDEVGAAAAASRAARPAALTEVSEWAVDEVMAAMGLTSRAAGQLLSESITLVEQLPATLAALETGTISWAHVRAMVDWVAYLDDEISPDGDRFLRHAAA